MSISSERPKESETDREHPGTMSRSSERPKETEMDREHPRGCSRDNVKIVGEAKDGRSGKTSLFRIGDGTIPDPARALPEA
jgi:hypothetical protein